MNPIRNKVLTLIFVSTLLVRLSISAQSNSVHGISSEVKKQQSPAVGASSNYLINVGDIVAVDVWNEAELSKTIPVRPDGKISLPAIGEVDVAGLTVIELENQIVSKLRKYVRDPGVDITIEQGGSETSGRVFGISVPEPQPKVLARASNAVADARRSKAPAKELNTASREVPNNVPVASNFKTAKMPESKASTRPGNAAIREVPKGTHAESSNATAAVSESRTSAKPSNAAIEEASKRVPAGPAHATIEAPESGTSARQDNAAIPQAYKNTYAESSSAAAVAPESKILAAVSNDYLIGIGDVIAVNVWKELELSKAMPVRPDGKISLPVIGEIDAAGLTVSQLEAQIVVRLKEYIKTPEVNVIVQEIRSKTINVMGKVLKGGTFVLTKPTTVFDALALTGGFQEYARTTKIYVLRAGSNGQQLKIPFNYKEFIQGKKPGSNIQLQSGDTVVIP